MPYFCDKTNGSRSFQGLLLLGLGLYALGFVVGYHLFSSFYLDTELLCKTRIVRSSPHSASLLLRRERHYLALAFIAHAPILAHLAGVGQPLQGLKGAAFLPAGALAIIIFFPYIMGILQLGVNGTSRFLQLSFWVALQTVSPQLCQRVSHALLQHTQQG